MNKNAEEMLRGLLWAAQNHDYADTAAHLKAMMGHWFETRALRTSYRPSGHERVHLDTALHEIVRLAFINDEFHPFKNHETLTQWRIRKAQELYAMLLGAAQDEVFLGPEAARRINAVVDACREMVMRGFPAEDTERSPSPKREASNAPRLKLVT